MIDRTKQLIGASAQIYFSELQRWYNTDYADISADICQSNEAEYKYATSYQDRIAQEARVPSGLQKAMVLAADLTPLAALVGAIGALVISLER